MKFLKALGARVYGLMVKFPLAVAAAAALIVGAVVMKLLGHDVQIGGLLDKLFGRKPNLDVRVIPPPGRTDASGGPIQPGKPDDIGYVQAPVSTEIVKPGIFSNPDTIVVKHPDKGDVVLPLPTGVKNKDVSEVIEVSPGVFQIKNNDNSSVDTAKLKDILG